MSVQPTIYPDEVSTDGYVLPEEAAKLAGVPIGTIWCWSSRRQIKRYRANGRTYYEAAEVLRIEAQTRRRPRIMRVVADCTQQMQDVATTDDVCP